MALSPTAAWTNAMGKSVCSPVWTLRIDFDATNQQTFVSGDTPLFGHANSLIDVVSVATELDVERRLSSISELSAVFRDDQSDDLFRSLVAAKRTFGKKVTIKLGEQSLDESDFLTVAVMVVYDIIPEEGVIVLRCRDLFSMLDRQTTSKSWVSRHPLDVIEELLTDASIPAAMIDSTSFDPTDAANDALSHYTVTRAHATRPFSLNSAPDNERVRDVVDQLMLLMDGTLVIDGSGKFSFSRYDSTAAVTRTWLADQILDVRQISTHEHLANRVRLTAHTYESVTYGAAKHKDFSVWFEREDTLSQTNHAPLGMTSLVTELNLGSPWMNGVGFIHSVVNGNGALPASVMDSTATSFRVTEAGQNGFAGCRFTWSGSTQQFSVDSGNGAGLSSSKPAYLLISGYARITGSTWSEAHYEIIKAESITLADHTKVSAIGGTGIGAGPWPAGIKYSSLTRGQFGSTTPAAWVVGLPGAHGGYGVSHVWDITIAVNVVQNRLARMRNGIPILEVRTPLDQADLTVGDLVTFEDTIPVYFGKNGVGTTTVWEIVRAETRPLEDSPGCFFRLAWVRDDVVYSPTDNWNQQAIPKPPYGGQTLVFDKTGLSLLTANNQHINSKYLSPL